VFNPSYLAALYLQTHKFDKKVYVFGSKGITQELDEVGIKHFGVGVSNTVETA
jgi:phosphoglycolate phosphatase